MFSGILNWAEHEKKLTEFAWILNANCKNNDPKNCLFNHYLEMYLKQRAQGVLTLNSLPVAATFAWFILVGLSATTIWLGGIPITPLLLFAEIIIYAIGNIAIAAMQGYHQESLRERFNKAAKRTVLTKAKNDYLQLIFSLLADSAIHVGATVEVVIEKVTPFKVDEPVRTQPINLITLSNLRDYNFFSKARQVIPLVDNQKQTGFFKIFVHSPKPGEMLLMLESEKKRYTLKADKFNLIPLLTLLNESGVGFIQLSDDRKDIILQ